MTLQYDNNNTNGLFYNDTVYLTCYDVHSMETGSALSSKIQNTNHVCPL